MFSCIRLVLISLRGKCQCTTMYPCLSDPRMSGCIFDLCCPTDVTLIVLGLIKYINLSFGLFAKVGVAGDISFFNKRSRYWPRLPQLFQQATKG